MNDPVYNWQALPDFTLADSISGTLVPETAVGYDIDATKISTARRRQALASANGILSGLNPTSGLGARSRVRGRWGSWDAGVGDVRHRSRRRAPDRS